MVTSICEDVTGGYGCYGDDNKDVYLIGEKCIPSDFIFLLW